MTIENNNSSTIARLFVGGVAVLAAAAGMADARPAPFYRIGGHLDLWEHPQGRPDAGEALALSIPGDYYAKALQKPQRSGKGVAARTAHEAQGVVMTKVHSHNK